MIISFFINTLSSGGAEHQLSILANLLCQEGHTVNIVTYGDLADHYTLDKSINRIRIAENKTVPQKLIGIFKYFFKPKEDIIISFCQQNNLISGLCLRLSPYKRKFIVGERNCSLYSPTRAEKFLFKYIYPKANKIVTNSYSQAEFLKRFAPQLSNNIQTIINFTDTSLYKNDKAAQDGLNNDHSNIRFCVVARYDKQKNYERFALALKKLRERGYQFYVDWYGAKYNNGHVLKNEYLEFDNFRKDFKLEGCLRLNDSEKNIAAILPDYDFFCLPSLFEGFSNAISEAICCGLPAVVSDVSDNHVMVHEGENGFLFDANNPDDIATALEKMINLNKEQRLIMSEKSREIALKLFNKDSFLQSYRSIINS